MKKDLTEIIEKGSKAKVIELAINSREFRLGSVKEAGKVGIRENLLTNDEIEAIKERARKEGWGGELERATYKAKDLSAVAVETILRIYKAMYFLREYIAQVEKINIILKTLSRKYIKGWDEETESYTDIKEATEEELRRDIEEVISNNRGGFANEFVDMDLGLIVSMEGFTLGKEVEGVKKSDIKKTKITAFRLYEKFMEEVKVSFYGFLKSKVGGYRLYSKSDYDGIYIGLEFFSERIIRAAVNHLDHLEYLTEMLEKYKPEILQLLKEKDFYIPTQKETEEEREFLDEVAKADLPNERVKEYLEKFKGKGKESKVALRNEMDKEREKVLISDEFLLKGVKKELVDMTDRIIEEMKEWVLYGK